MADRGINAPPVQILSIPGVPMQIERHRDPEDAGVHEARAVWDALLAPLPTTDPRYFYDDHGSELFERITRLEEYYQTRTELALLERIADDVIAAAQPRELVELGSGIGRKITLLLDAMAARGWLEGCTLLEINEAFLAASLERLSADYPAVELRGVVGDFTRDLHVLAGGRRRLVVFLAGTIGNLGPAMLTPFLEEVRASLGDGDRLLVGLDLVKDRARLEAAYNDAEGVTAAFNRNVLAVLNARFGTDFEPASFEHVARWDADREWIEMRLRASRPMHVRMPSDPRPLVLEAGAEIRTELSRKFTRDGFRGHLERAGLVLERWDTDPDELFCLALVAPAA